MEEEKFCCDDCGEEIKPGDAYYESEANGENYHKKCIESKNVLDVLVCLVLRYFYTEKQAVKQLVDTLEEYGVIELKKAGEPEEEEDG